jgi:NAD(P)-dependent dehydrogenase (short-subunit alcohol dehydrogenase family)
VTTSVDTDVALVTGAAGSIGCATVRSFASRGLRVVTADRRPLPPGEAKVVARELHADLTDDSIARRAFAELGGLGRLGHVIAVAGGGDVEELSQTDPATEPLEIFARVVENNLTSAFVTIRHAVPLLRDGNGDRSVTLVGSINAFGGYGAPGYSAAKAGLVGLTKALATPLGADGIRINCLALGTVDTENLHDLADARGVELDLTAFASRAPLKRVLDPEDVASALTALALDMPGLTGATIVLDNGQTLIR